MKLPLLTLLSCLAIFSTFAQTKPKAKVIPQTKLKATISLTKVPVKEFSNQMDSVSYAVGVLVAQNFKSQNVTLNPEMVAKGFASVVKGDKLSMSEAECQNVMNSFMMKNQERQAAESAKQFFPNKEAGEKFLAENKKKDSVVTTASGLQYKIIKMGTGPKPLATDKVKTHYHGTLIDGQVFDSSVQRGEPISFPVSGVIPGWVEALQLMPVGSKWKLYIPQELAYGIRGGGQTIKPYSALIFEVELIEIEK
jgi:FKBP-type peptidyl-prolyl cis-trans isomerase FklB